MNAFSRSPSEKLFDASNLIIMILLAFVTLYPFYNILITSINDPVDAARGGITFWPRSLSIDNYKVVFQDNVILKAFAVTVARTLIGTFTAVFFTAAFAYGISRNDFYYVFQRWLNSLLFINS
jgi:putative aldouronate transport system permease protein